MRKKKKKKLVPGHLRRFVPVTARKRIIIEKRAPEKKPIPRWPALLVLPFLALGRAVYASWKALRGGEVRALEAEGRLEQPYLRSRHKVTSRDGTRLTASLWVPEGEGPFPLIIMVHSWMFWRLQCDLLYAASFARRGYAVLTYDCRGWGSSSGQVHCLSPERELCDLQDMIDWVTDPENGFPVDRDKIGITGVSYGGGHSFLIAARDSRIKAAAPMNGWTDLYQALVPNDCWKTPWSIMLFATALWAHRMSPRNPLVGWLKTMLTKWDARALKEELDERSVRFDVENINCPMFIVHSWNDDLFEPNQVLDFYTKLDVAKKLHVSNGIHGFDPGRGDFLAPNRIWDDARRWFDYWLKGDRDNGILSEPAVTFYQPWNGEMGTADNWPPEGVADVVYFLAGDASTNRGRLSQVAPRSEEVPERIVNNTVSSLQSSGPPLVRPAALGLPVPVPPFSVPGDSVAFTTEVFTQEAVMVGAPRVEIYASSSTHECQLNALLVDVSPGGFCRLVTHQAMMKSGLTPGEAVKFEFELIACAHRFEPGHRARLVLCAADPLYVFPSRVPSQYRVAHDAGRPSSLSLPLMKTTAG